MKPNVQAVSAGGFGLAIGIVLVWGIEVGGSVSVPGVVGTAIGTISTVVAQRLYRWLVK